VIEMEQDSKAPLYPPSDCILVDQD